jgi:hypothetical protein
LRKTLSGCRGSVNIERTDKNALRTDYKVNSHVVGVLLRKKALWLQGRASTSKEITRTRYGRITRLVRGPGEQLNYAER